MNRIYIEPDSDATKGWPLDDRADPELEQPLTVQYHITCPTMGFSGYKDLSNIPAGEICLICKRQKGTGLHMCNFTIAKR